MLERKVASNPRYKDVQGKLNTGLTVDKLKSITPREYVRRKDEIHYRINKRQLFELYDEYERDQEHFGGDSPVYGGQERTGHTPRIVTHSELAMPEYDKPYLLLDVRPVEDYNRAHLMQARSYPYTMCRRDFMHPDIYKFKNKENTLIILYCDDERISRDVAKTLVDRYDGISVALGNVLPSLSSPLRLIHRGTDNIFLLTGGLHDFALEYPSYIEGDVPNLPSPPQRPKPFAFLLPIGENAEDFEGDDATQRGQRSSRGQRVPLTARSNASRASLRPPLVPMTGRSRMGVRSGGGMRGDDDARSESGMSTRSNFSVAESICSRAMAKKGAW